MKLCVGTITSVGWSKEVHTADPDAFLRIKLPESSSETAVTLRLAVPEDQTGVVEVEEGRSWRSPEATRRTTAEEFTEAEEPPAFHMGMLLKVIAAYRAAAPPVSTESVMKERVVPLGEVHLEFGSDA